LNRGVRFLLLGSTLLLAGCQVVAGIDDRVVAPISVDADSTVEVDSSLDSGLDTAIADAGVDQGIDQGVDSSITDSGTDTLDTGAPDTAPEVEVDSGPLAAIVVNEVKASSTDFLELYNTSAEPVDISGWGVTGTDDAGGFSSPVRFAAGTVLQPGEFLLIVAGQLETRGPIEDSAQCLGAASCYHSAWGISQSRGETIRVLETGATVHYEVTYPANGVPDARSWGRLPDGTGAFGNTKPTPGSANAAN
jgi:hypothetical protein